MQQQNTNSKRHIIFIQDMFFLLHYCSSFWNLVFCPRKYHSYKNVSNFVNNNSWFHCTQFIQCVLPYLLHRVCFDIRPCSLSVASVLWLYRFIRVLVCTVYLLCLHIIITFSYLKQKLFQISIDFFYQS